MPTNRELLKALRPPIARFYPCDLHVHSVASADVSVGDRFEALPAEWQSRLTKLSRVPDDLAVHDRQMLQVVSPELFHAALVRRRDEVSRQSGQSDSDNWAFLAVTDHNTAYYSSALSQYGWSRRAQDRLIVLPGVELDITFPFGETSGANCVVHLLCVFPPCTGDADILLAINHAQPEGSRPWTFGSPLCVHDLPSFVRALRLNQHCSSLCIAAHVSSSKGIESEPKMVVLNTLHAEIARVEGALQRAIGDQAIADERELREQLADLQSQCDSQELHIEVLRLIGRCGFDALQVRDQTDELHYRRLHRFLKDSGRAVPIISSDAHTPDHVWQCPSGVPYIKLSRDPSALSPCELFAELREHSLRLGETRTTSSNPGRVVSWIEGFEVTPDSAEARQFWHHAASTSPPAAGDTSNSFLLPLSRNLNCLVGGRGSGKSAAIEAIAFLTQPSEFSAEAEKREADRSDWYGRAAATLQGCRVRLVFKTTSTAGIGGLPKRALVASRYFDPNGEHLPVEYRDADSQPVVASDAKPPRVSIFRVHDIEEAARPANLRRLFDQLCGEQVVELTAKIEDLRSQLARQRQDILEDCRALADLTAENGPLRQYGLRKRQFSDVNRPEIQDKYAKVDRLQLVAAETGNSVEAWSEIDAVHTIDTLDTTIESFFTAAAASMTDANGETKEGFHASHQLVARLSPDQPGHHEAAIRQPLQQARTALSSFAMGMENVRNATDSDLEAARTELIQAGLPPGSQDREAKKRALDEAEAALAKYRVLLASLAEKLKARESLFASLVSLCQQRTGLRKETADALTRQLSQDLDADILRIQLDARPTADRAELDAWLGDNIGPVFQRFRPQRLTALLNSGIMPGDLKRILLHEHGADHALLRIDRARADEGRITDDEVKTIVAACQGRTTVPLDGFDEFSPEFRADLPEEIREGLWSFPSRSGRNPALTADAVLQLDEIVLDDLPEIGLNDRPSDPASISRPLSELSPGQRCSAILPVLLLSGDTPLVIDQPEENLDNRLIRQVIVNILASMKLRRQVIVATHNPNLPVLGDAEQCIVLQASGGHEGTVIATGDLDSPKVASFITEIMEGGREAFQYRHTVYQSHWNSVLDESPNHQT
jgi:hypothetical protein